MGEAWQMWTVWSTLVLLKCSGNFQRSDPQASLEMINTRFYSMFEQQSVLSALSHARSGETSEQSCHMCLTSFRSSFCLLFLVAERERGVQTGGHLRWQSKERQKGERGQGYGRSEERSRPGEYTNKRQHVIISRARVEQFQEGSPLSGL